MPKPKQKQKQKRKPSLRPIQTAELNDGRVLSQRDGYRMFYHAIKNILVCLYDRKDGSTDVTFFARSQIKRMQDVVPHADGGIVEEYV